QPDPEGPHQHPSAAPLSEKPPAPAGGGCPVEQAQTRFDWGCPAGSPATQRGVIRGTPPEWTGDPRVSGEIACPRRRLASPAKPLHRAHRPRNLTVVRIATRMSTSGSLV